MNSKPAVDSQIWRVWDRGCVGGVNWSRGAGMNTTRLWRFPFQLQYLLFWTQAMTNSWCLFTFPICACPLINARLEKKWRQVLQRVKQKHERGHYLWNVYSVGTLHFGSDIQYTSSVGCSMRADPPWALAEIEYNYSYDIPVFYL